MKATLQKEVPKPTAQPIPQASTNGYQLIPVLKLHSNPNQPRQVWDEGDDEEGKTKLERLAESIRSEGILQPLVVTPRNGSFLIVCGERRYRAAKLAKLDQVPCIVKHSLDDKAVLELSITENLQREDLTPIDEAKAIKALMTKCGYSQARVGERLGLSVAAVNYKLSLLDLSPDLQKDVKKGALTETQGRTIVQAVRSVPAAKRPDAMASIKDRLAKTKAAKPGQKLSTKDVRTVAKTTAEQHVRVGASTVKGTPKPKPEQPKPPTPKEKVQASKFAKVMGSAEKSFLPFAQLVLTSDTGVRFGQVLNIVAPRTAEGVRKVNVFLARMLEHLNEAKRRALVSKIQ
jgi:ParB family chromosome partitioning protein